MNLRELDPLLPDPTPAMNEAMDRCIDDDSMYGVEAVGIGPDGWSLLGAFDNATLYAQNNSRWSDA